MKQISLKKTEVDDHRAWYDTDGPHFAHDKTSSWKRPIGKSA